MTKISQLTATTTLNTTDEFALARSGTNRKVAFSDLRNEISSFVGNTIFVDSIYGNDLTGEVENQAKPFATIAAAHAAGAAYWTGGTAPSLTNQITMNINGYFVEDVVIVSYYNYDLNGAIEGYLEDNTVVAVCSIYGSGTIGIKSGIAISLLAASQLIVKIDNIYGTVELVDSGSTIQIYDANMIATSTSSNFYRCIGAIKCYNCYITAVTAENIEFGDQGIYEFNNCSMASVSRRVVYPSTVNSNSTYLTFNDCYLLTAGTNLPTIEFRNASGTNPRLILKDCTLISNGSGNSIRAAQATNVYIYGSCQTNLTHDTGDVTLLVGTVANGRFLIDAAVI